MQGRHASPPNVLFIVSDQHNAKCVGHEGHPDAQTPHLDRLAGEGTRFNAAITQNPICTPSRVSFLSGQYCHNHGFYGLSGPNPNGLPNIFGHLRNHGYTTGAFGKIHCPEYWVEDACDVFHESAGCSISGRSAEYARFLAERDATDREDHKGFREFGARGTQSCDARASEASYEESQEGWVAMRTVQFMREAQDRGEPFMAFASLPKPHQAYAPSPEFWEMYDEASLTLPPSCGMDLEAAGKAPNLIRQAEVSRKAEWTLFEPHTFEAGRRRKLRGYLGNVTQVDRAVGDMLEGLDALGLAENTIVVYTSDHGDYATEFDIMEKAPGICADAITRVPMLWRVPGVTRAGAVNEQIAELVDVPQTICALTGVPLLETADGRDITTLLEGGDEPVHDIGVTEFAFSKSVRRGKYRLVWYPRERFPDKPEGFGELYDLDADPWEMQNLYFDPAYAEIVNDLTARLTDWLVTTTRPTSSLAVNNGMLPETDDPRQFQRRYDVFVNADRKVSPDHVRRAIASGRTDNYI
jgi:choline-sulfatase/uncharacterized sulfatase